MTPIEYAIKVVELQRAVAGQQNVLLEPAKDGRLTALSMPAPRFHPKPMPSARQVARNIDIPAAPRRTSSLGQFNRKVEQGLLSAALKNIGRSEAAEAPRAQQQYEDQLFREAEHEALERRERRRREIARCDAEIRHNQSKPPDVNEKAYLVALGTRDWEAERELLLAEEES
jgi:hypothetical protein